jgi:hypothetical protein
MSNKVYKKLRKRINCFATLFFIVFFVSIVNADIIDITDPELIHFANFYNDPPAPYQPVLPISHISSDPATIYGDYGWHDSPLEQLPEYAGILLESSYAVTTLRLQVHVSPFKDFILQGSTDTTTGLDGSWDNILTSTVTELGEFEWQEWNFSNTNLYSAYRIEIENIYDGGWAMYRWELLADTDIVPLPIPTTFLLFGSGLLGMFGLRRRIGATTV